jgi:ABC-2 type transport system ATP-binding protein/lipopolysaccharide transport system ATP-binding protein
MVEIGDPEDISRMYEEINFGGIGAVGLEGRERPGVRITGAWCEDSSGQKLLAREQGLPCVACMELEFDSPIDDPRFSIAFRNDTRHTIYVPGTDGSGERRSFAAGDRVVVCFRFDNWLAPSRYTLTPRVASADGSQTLDVSEDLSSLIVESSRRSGGVADIPADVEIRQP